MPFKPFENTLECFLLWGSWKSENMESHFQIKNMHDHQIFKSKTSMTIKNFRKLLMVMLISQTLIQSTIFAKENVAFMLVFVVNSVVKIILMIP